MFSNNVFGSFYPVDSSVHKLSPIIKLINLFLLIIFMLSTNNLKLIILSSILILLQLFQSRVPLKFYLNITLSLRYIMLFIIFVMFFTNFNLEIIIVTIIKLINFILYLSILTYTTSHSELNYGIEKILSPFNIFNLKINKFALLITNTIRFIPLISKISNKALKSQASRGLDYNHSNINKRIYARINILTNTISLSFKQIIQIKKASEIKMFDSNKYRTNLRTNIIKANDIFYLGFYLLLIAGSILERGLI